MRRILATIRAQYLGLTALILVLAGGAYAATGGELILGSRNQADRPTAIRNTGNGPALQLNVKANQPPLRVNSRKLVPGLNAGLLRGRPPKAFAPARNSRFYVAAGTVYSKEESDSRYAPTGQSYTKAESDARYANLETSYLKSDLFTRLESDARYALKTDSYTRNELYTKTDLYTRGESDARYLRSTGPQILAMEVVASPDETFLDRNFTAPAAGKIHLQVIGRCDDLTKTWRVVMSLRVGASSKINFTFAGPTEEITVGCNLALSRVVQPGQAVNVKASYGLEGGATLTEATVLVIFIPS